MESPAVWEVVKGTAFASAISVFALRRKSLNARGTAAAWVVFIVTYAASRWHVAVLLGFFFSSTLLTKIGKGLKAKREEGYGESKGRNEWQVFANGGFGTLLAGLWVCYPRPSLLLGYLVHYGVAAGDTWASELGILSPTLPRLILGFKQVPHGTNGGITPTGTLASVAGGATIAAAGYLAGLPAGEGGSYGLLSHVGVGGLAGFLGSSVDSILGQLFEFSGWDAAQKRVTNTRAPGAEHISGKGWLHNDHVNFLATFLTSTASMVVADLLSSQSP